jgi:hypothetical protein
MRARCTQQGWHKHQHVSHDMVLYQPTLFMRPCVYTSTPSSQAEKGHLPRAANTEDADRLVALAKVGSRLRQGYVAGEVVVLLLAHVFAT